MPDTEQKTIDPMLKRYIQNSLIQVQQETKAARLKARGQGSRQRAKRRAQNVAA